MAACSARGSPLGIGIVEAQQTDGRGNDRLGASAFRGSRRRLRDSISAGGPEITYTKIGSGSVLPWTIATSYRIADGIGTYLFHHAVKFALDLFLCEEIPPWRVIECDAQCSAKSSGRE